MIRHEATLTSRLMAAALLLLLGTPGTAREASAEETEDGFTDLFDGKSLQGWDGDPKLWSVQDGVILGQTSNARPIEQNAFLIWNGSAADFVLRIEFRIADRGIGNSGVQYRSKRFPDAGPWVVRGYQADIERTNQYMGILYEEGGRGILAMRGEEVVLRASPEQFDKQVIGSVGDPAALVEGVAPGEWQTLEAIAIGNRLEHKLNGKTTIRATDDDGKHSASEGVIALQLHQGPEMQIEFRNIRIKNLSTDTPQP